MWRRSLAFAYAATVAFAANNISAPSVTVEPPTFQAIGIVIQHNDDDNRNATVQCRFRQVGATTWRNAQPLMRVPIERVTWKSLPRQFAGSIFDLRPDTAYEVQLTIQDPDGFSSVVTTTARTKALLSPPATPRTVNVNTVAQLREAARTAAPGDIILLAPGVYVTDTIYFNNGGTAANPVIVRGTARDTTILDGGGCYCNILEFYAGHVRVENLTLRNAFQAVRFYGPTTGVAVLHTRITDVTNGINTQQPAQSGFVLADNIIEGRIPFTRPFYTPDDTYAIQLYGSNHIVAHNEVRGFMDCIRLFGGSNRNVDVYGNDVLFCFDDGIESDAVEGNIRIQRNRVNNSDSGISLQPSAGGPVYVLRNIVLNARNEQFKLHGTGGGNLTSGVRLYHNTTLNPVAALQMYSSQAVYEMLFRNNIFVGPPASRGAVVIWDAPLFNVHFDNDGYFPDGVNYWKYEGTYRSYPNLAALFAGGMYEANGRQLTGDVFATGINGGSNIDQYFPPQLPRLRPGQNAIDAALPLANINDDSPGGPDLGALESGCAPPHYGPRPAGVNESNQVFGCGPGASNVAPAVEGVVTVSSSGNARQYRARVTDGNGFADVETVTLLAGPSTSLQLGCAAVLRRSREEIYLWNDAATALLGPVRPAENATVENSRCVLSGATSSVRYLSEANLVEFTAGVNLKAGFPSPAVTVAQAVDQSGANSGEFPAVQAPPEPAEPSPSSGSGSSQTFRFSFRNQAGWADLSVVNVLINSAVDGRAACYVAYVPTSESAGAVYLVDDAGNAGGPFAGMALPGTGNVENSQCRLSGAGSFASASGDTLQLTLNIEFKSGFAGNRVFYTAARTKTGRNSGWYPLGTWQVPGSSLSGPAVASLSPARSTSRTQTFTLTVQNPAGWQDLQVVNLLINSALDGRSACYLAFVPSTSPSAGTWYLTNDAGNAATGLAALPLPGSASVANSQCSVSASGATVTASQNTLTVTLPVTFSSSFSGNRVIYGAARTGTQNSGWQAIGTVTVP
jgi:hypothetical protein